MSQASTQHRVDAPLSLLAPADRAALPVDAVDAYPLSALQSGVLFEAIRAGRPGVYHDVLTYRMSGELNVAAFTGAVREVVRRHPICRTSFHLDGFTEPVQIVHADGPPPLRITDLRGRSEQDRSARLAEAVDREIAEGFRYGTPDLVRFGIHLLTDHEYQYTLSYHDAAIDSASVRVINHDLFEAYLRLRSGAGHPAPAAPSPTGYRDFVAAERAALASPEAARFWLDTLAGAEGSLIPRYGDVPAGTDNRLVIRAVDLPDGLAEAVLGVAAEMGVPVPTVLTTAHIRVLSLLTGSADVLTGYEHSGRPATEQGALLAGLFLNTLPLRVHCGPGSWRDLIRAVHEATLAWRPYHRFPMPEIKRRLGVRGPLVETVCNVTSTHDALGDLAERYGFVLPRADLNARTEFPFRAEFGHDSAAGGVRLALHHHAVEFSAAQIDRIAGYYRAALRALSSAPDAPHHEAGLLDPEETRLVTGGFGGRRCAAPAGTFVDLFTESTRRWPDRTAVVHRDERLSYAELRGAAEALADRLAGAGLAPGTVCAVALPRGIDWAVTALAVLLRAGVYLPVDPTHPPARIARSVARAGAALLVTDPGSASTLEQALAERDGPACRVCTVAATSPVDPAGSTDPAGRATAVAPAGEQDAYILFTSGSTGEPKGARITHAGMLNHLLAKVDELDLGPDDRVAQTASQCFDISVWQLLAAWTVGARTVIYDTATVTDAPSFLAGLSTDGITVVELVPSYLDAVLVENARRPRPLPRLRYGIVTGEPVPAAVVRRWFEHLGVPLINAYGPTEAADDVTHLVLTGPPRGTRVPVGRPIRNTGVHVIGPDGRHRPIGCYGEIVVTGAGVGPGYVNDPERTARVFHRNTLDDRSGLMYHTGDVGRWLPDGVLDCAGRLDDQVKLRGFRIELAEVSGAVTALPGVDSAVAAVTGGGQLVVGYLGPATLDTGAARAALSGVLPAYMLPDAVAALDRIPLTANGKVDQARLVAEVTAVGTPGPDRRREFCPPATATERQLAEVFALVLGVPADQVGVDDDFFAVGGHSLAAMKLAARSDGRLALRDIVTHPTVRALARLLDSGSDAPRPLLISLTDAPAGGPALVCAPYAGGGAVNFLPMARVLSRRAPHLAVYGVEPPGRTRTDPLPASSGLDRALVAVADELSQADHDSVAVYGHCSGSVLAVRLAGLLEQRGVRVTRVFAAAKVLSGTDPTDYATDEFATYTDQAVVDWVRTTIGMVELDDLRPDQLADLAQAFRTDSVESTRMLHEALSTPDRARLRCPLTQVVALDDALTADHAAACRHWGVLADEVTATTLPDGGHYFNRTRPDQVAALVADALDAAR